MLQGEGPQMALKGFIILFLVISSFVVFLPTHDQLDHAKSNKVDEADTLYNAQPQSAYTLGAAGVFGALISAILLVFNQQLNVNVKAAIACILVLVLLLHFVGIYYPHIFIGSGTCVDFKSFSEFDGQMTDSLFETSPYGKMWLLVASVLGLLALAATFMLETK